MRWEFLCEFPSVSLPEAFDLNQWPADDLAMEPLPRKGEWIQRIIG